MRQKAQGIMEYVTLLAIVGAALITMQLYFKQGIQAGIKPFADYIGSQKKGSAEDDYQYIWFTDGEKGLRAVSNLTSEEDRSTTTDLNFRGVTPGKITYDRDDTTSESGLAHWSVGIERERAKVQGP